jgi:hypothetical protein
VGSSNISKIERVSAPQNSTLWVDLCLNKERGVFFAEVGGEHIEEETKAKAIEKIKTALNRVTQVDWRQVILIRVDKRRVVEEEDDERGGTENGKPVYTAHCSFTYLRRERAKNPLKPKETIEREHEEDFELQVAEARDRAGYFERGARKKERADQTEREMREKRAILAGVRSQWDHFGDHVVEYELPYSKDAWAGIRRIAQALRDTQAKLDEFARGATTEKLAALVTGDVLKALPPAPPPPPKKPKEEEDDDL